MYLSLSPYTLLQHTILQAFLKLHFATWHCMKAQASSHTMRYDRNSFNHKFKTCSKVHFWMLMVNCLLLTVSLLFFFSLMNFRPWKKQLDPKIFDWNWARKHYRCYIQGWFCASRRSRILSMGITIVCPSPGSNRYVQTWDFLVVLARIWLFPLLLYTLAEI